MGECRARNHHVRFVRNDGETGDLDGKGTSRGDGWVQGTTWLLSAYSVSGQQAEASGAQRTLRAAPSHSNGDFL